MKRALIGSDLMIHQSREQAFNLDTILLQHFVRVPYNANKIIDFGTGTGVLMLYLSKKTKAQLIGVEVQKNRYEQAIKNIEANQLQDQISCLHQDIKDLTIQQFKDIDLIVSNPPFFKMNDKQKVNDDLERTIARHEVLINLEQLIKKASELIKYKGSFQFIHRPDRFLEITSLLHAYQFEIKRIQFVHPYKNQEANHVLIEASKHGKTGCKILPPLILYKEKHQMTEELISIYGGDKYVT